MENEWTSKASNQIERMVIRSQQSGECQKKVSIIYDNHFFYDRILVPSLPISPGQYSLEEKEESNASTPYARTHLSNVGKGI